MEDADRPDLHPLAEVIPPSERLVFRGGAVTIGSVRCAPGDRHFRRCGDAREFSFVFPRAAVTICRPDAAAFVEDPTVVSFYNRGQEYERFEVSPDGDCCEWFGVAEPVVREAVRDVDPGAADHPTHPLRRTHAPSPPDIFRRQRALVERVRSQPAADPLYVEETVLSLLGEVVRRAADGSAGQPTADAAGRALADAAKQLIAAHVPEPLRLGDLAGQLEVSVFRLCRAFKSTTGTTLHRYSTELRLRHALARLLDGGSDLGQVAVDCGFGSHSHFTALFRRYFGVTPSRARLDPLPAASRRSRMYR